MEALAKWIVEDEKCNIKICLDVGCGSEILALAAAHLGMNAYGIDIEEDAMQRPIKMLK